MSSGLRKEYTETIMQEAPGNRIKHMQRIFQAGTDPIHIKTVADKRYFRFVMPATYVAMAGSLGIFVYMALGKMKRSPPS